MFNTSNCSINQNATYVLTKEMCLKLLQITGSKRGIIQASRVDLCNRVMPERFFDCDHRIVCTWACFLISYGYELSRHMTPPAVYYTLQIPAREFGSRDEKIKEQPLGELHLTKPSRPD